MPPSLSDRLTHILTAIEHIRALLRGRSRAEFAADLTLRMAVERLFEIIAKAGFHITVYEMAGKDGTHVDPPAHFAENGITKDDIPLKPGLRRAQGRRRRGDLSTRHGDRESGRGAAQDTQ